jgi:histidine triad (HIT) family protein
MKAPAYDDSNVFAKILRGELPSHKVYEDEHCIAVMDVMPQGKGHTLVIPKAASRNILDISAHDLQNLMLAVQQLARAVVKAFDAQGVNVIMYGEPAAGQTVFHTHVHVIPRFHGVPLKPHTGKMADQDELADDAFRVRAVLGGLG